MLGSGDEIMPQWLIPLISGALLLWLGQRVQSFSRREQYRHEKLMDRHAEFVGAASAEVDRVRSLAAGLALCPREGDFSGLQKLDADRHQGRRDLTRIAMQIRMLETNRELSQLVAELVQAVPYMVYPFPPWVDQAYRERFTKHQADIQSFDDRLSNLIDRVLSVHAVVNFGALGRLVRRRRRDGVRVAGDRHERG
jgi:hypothetical protein